MRKLLVIAGNSLLLAARDPKALLFALVLPLAATLIMGTFLKGLFGAASVPPAPVLIVNRDPQYGAALAQALGSPDLRKTLTAETTVDLDAARAQVAAGKAVAVLYIPPAFTADALAGRGAQVQVYTDPGDPTRGALVTRTVQSVAEAVIARPVGGTAPATRITEESIGARPVSAMQYCAASMALLFMLCVAFMRGGVLLEERANGTLQRMLVTPTSRAQILAGQIAGSALLNLTQWLLLLIGTRSMLGVSWGSWPGAVALGAAFALASAGIGTAAAAVLKTRLSADIASGAVSNLLGVLSGAIVPLYTFPNGLRLIARFTPNYWAMQGFLDHMAGRGPGHLALPLAVLTATALMTGAFGVWRLAAK
jgi:ABC-2 type transport system permease protein